YFWPRPSAVSYNAAAAGASNWGANSPKLRDRVARQLGPIVKYNPSAAKKDASVQKDIEAWFTGSTPKAGEPALVVRWARDNPTPAVAWVKADANKPAVIAWLKAHPEILAAWRKEKPAAPGPDLADEKTIPFDDLAVPFFESFAAAHPKRWPEPEEYETGEK